MIRVTRLNGERFALNPDLIERVEGHPDTVAFLVDGTKYVVKESVDDWLWLSMGYDVTKRVLGTTHTTWGTFGRYGEAVEPRQGEDKPRREPQKRDRNVDRAGIGKVFEERQRQKQESHAGEHALCR